MRSSFPMLALLCASAFHGSASGQTLIRQLQLVDQVRAQPPFLGVGITDVNADRLGRLKMNEERGVEVTNVEEGSPADTAGVKAGDVLLTYNGENILSAQQFTRLVRETPVGRHVGVSLWRNGREQRITVTPVGAPAFAMGSGAEELRKMTRDLHGLRGPEGQFLALQGPNSFEFVIPDVPTVIMAWNSSAMGIECEPIDAQLAQYFGVKQGVLVRSVAKGTAGEKAGFRAGDVLLSVGDHAIKTPDDLHRSIRPGTGPFPVSLMRDHKQLTLNVIPSSDRQQ